jgi:hypothetical protein
MTETDTPTTTAEEKADTRLDGGAGGTATTGQSSPPANDLESSSAPNEDWGQETQTDEPNRV